jgi:ketosteroid isomerase-like protein
VTSLASLEHEEVEQFTREFEALFNAGDAAGMASFYAGASARPAARQANGRTGSRYR